MASWTSRRPRRGSTPRPSRSGWWDGCGSLPWRRASARTRLRWTARSEWRETWSGAGSATSRWGWGGSESRRVGPLYDFVQLLLWNGGSCESAVACAPARVCKTSCCEELNTCRVALIPIPRVDQCNLSLALQNLSARGLKSSGAHAFAAHGRSPRPSRMQQM